MNRQEINSITLTKDLSEQLSTIIKEIFKKVRKNSKIKNFSQLVEESKKFFDENNQDDILKKYKIQKPIKMFQTAYSNDINCSFNNSEKNIRYVKPNNYESISSSSLTKIRKKQNILSGWKINERIGNDYKFKKYKEDSKYFLPVEMLILMRKFNTVKKLKLTICNYNYSETNNNNDDGFENNNSSNSNEVILDQNDLQNNIFVLLNIDWLFESLVELEVDFSSENLTESIIYIYKYYLRKFSKLVHKDLKITTYRVNSFNKRYYEPIQKSLFSQLNTHINEEEHSSDVFSSSMTSNNLNYSISFNLNVNNLNNLNSSNNTFVIMEEKDKNALEKFLNKYKALLEMIIVYGYFIRKMTKIIKTKFILSLNLVDEI